MTANKLSKIGSKAAVALMATTVLSGVAQAQTAPPPAAAPAPQQQTPTTTPQPAPAPQQAPAQQQAPAPQRANPAAPAPLIAAPQVQRTIKSIRVAGNQRIEAETIIAYTQLRAGGTYTNETIDQALRDLLASDFLADVQIEGVETGDIIIRVTENPVINRVIFEGNRRLKTDKIQPEVKLAPRQIFTRTAVRADVARIVELYRRQGRFAASVDPQMVTLDQNRVDVVFEISEGPKSSVRQINIIGNEQFSDDDLRGEMATKQSRWFRILSSNTTYDQDRLAYDQQLLRQFYLTQGYADFRVVSAVAELTPDREDFIITYVVEEGERYKFGPVTVDSAIRDFDNEQLAANLPFKENDWYNAKQVEDSIEALSETAGLFGYAFADVNPQFRPDRENKIMAINFVINEAQRTYVERVNITGNTQTQDKVVRREMRVAEGDAFNTVLVRRSQDRINSLGYFGEKFEIEQVQGSAPDRVILNANVEERATGELSLSAGFSSLERFLVQAAIRQRNFRGKGQDLRAQVDYSTYSKSVELGFTEPYLFNQNVALGATVFRRDFNSFNFIGQERNQTYENVSTGAQLVAAVPLTEYWSLSGNYRLTQDDVSLDEAQFFTNGVCDPLKAGRYLCDAIGNRLTSAVGLNLSYNSLNSSLRPTRGERLQLGLEFAGLGGDTRFIRARADARKYWSIGSGFILSATGEGGYIHSLEEDRGPNTDSVRITDRFFLGEPQFRGFDIRGVGPRVQRIGFNGTVATGDQLLVTDREQIIDDALGGKAYYLGKLELEIPLGEGARELGLRPSIFLQAGALFGLKRPVVGQQFPQAVDGSGNPLFNADGSPSLLPLVTNITDAEGRQLYFVPTGGENAGLATTCPIGFSSTLGGACTGTSTNTIATNSTAPFFERYVGDSAKPRLSVGVGVNWNSPFGPLRIDVAHALLKEEGDDTKLFTFNVGTAF
ncbi:Outer membrane protein assembly factor BamA [Sphingomonas sp. AX6]|nr:outer membrane protein assembly factor BamA [Sphingomonas sp. AX6]VXD01344.1 Outer membrane protein assembly factor BamA [Sphingomonas sp. AX6]